MKGLEMIVLQVIGSWSHILIDVGHSLSSVSALLCRTLGSNIYQMMVNGDSTACPFPGIVLVIVLAICWLRRIFHFHNPVSCVIFCNPLSCGCYFFRGVGRRNLLEG